MILDYYELAFLKVLYEKEIIIDHKFKPPSSELQDTWWNGLYVAILQKQ